MFTDPDKHTLLDSLRQRDLRLFSQLLTPEHVAAAAKACGHPVGSSPLNLLNLTWLALASAWHSDKSFGEVLGWFFRLHEDLLLGETHAFSTHRLPTDSDRLITNTVHSITVSEEAFLLARRKVPPAFWNELLGILAAEFHRQHPTLNQFRRFRVLALDGTCLALPYSKNNLEAFGAASNGRGRKVPRARMVCLIFPFVRMLHSYCLGKYTCGERAMASQLLQQLHENDLVLMDKGFWSYGIFWLIQDKKAFFATRLKGRINLDKIKDLGPGDELVRHSPSDWRKTWKKDNLPASMELRIIRYQLPGFPASAVVTNVLDPNEISREEWIRLLEVDNESRVLVQAGLYHRRWEIEVYYREVKCDLGLEGSLRSRKAAGIPYEVGGYLLLHTLIRWRMAEAAITGNIDDPLRLSFTRCLNILEGMMWVAWGVPQEVVITHLLPRLLARMGKQQVPMRPNRHYPRRRDPNKPH